MFVDEDTQKWMITVVAALIAHVLADRIADKYLDEPEVRGVRDDIKEAFIKGSFRFASTVLASVLVRKAISGRWGR